MGLLKGVVVFAVQVLAPLLLVVWAMARWRKPLWIRWAAGGTAYILYVHLAHSWLRTRTNWEVVTGFADVFTVFTWLVVLVLRGGPSSDEEARAAGASMAKAMLWLGPLKLAWIEFAVLPALALAAVHYTRRFVAWHRARSPASAP